MSSYTDDAFDCESPHAILASSCELQSEQRKDVQVAGGDEALAYAVADNVSLLRLDSGGGSNGHDAVPYGDLAQPRPEIILRWKRFAILVVLLACVMSSVAAWLREGFVVDKNVPVSDAEHKTDTVNSYIGLMMGFIESFVALGVEEIFPVFIVYLHNLKWYPGDDPATKKQSKLKKFTLTIFIPAVMMAVGSSLSAVQANQKDDNAGGASDVSTDSTLTRYLMKEVTELRDSDLTHTILKTALARKVKPMQPLAGSACSYNDTDPFAAQTLLSSAPRAIFGFPLREWGAEFGNGWSRKARKQHEIFYRGASGNEQRSDDVRITIAQELWSQGQAVLRKSVRAASEYKEDVMPSSADELLAHVLRSLHHMKLPLADGAAVDASFETMNVSSSITLDALTLKVPIYSPSNATVVCGKTSCAWLHPELNAKQLLPRKQIGMVPLDRNCSSMAECDKVPYAAFLYGFTTVAAIASETAGMTRMLVMSFARLTWVFDSVVAECESVADREEGCRALQYQLGGSGSGRVLVERKQQLPAQLQAGYATSPISLVRLVDPKIRLLSAGLLPFVTLERLDSWPLGSTRACTKAVDVYLQYVDSNCLYLDDDMVEAMAASALLYIFQDAQIAPSAMNVEKEVDHRRLAITTTRRVKVFLTNTWVGNVCTWTGCGVLLLLTALVLVLPNERARLAPSRGGNARAERFVAVQTEQVYPNLIYKKRFLIGKTGEEIKFGEFAVESVGLHHKMEEDEQIYI